MLALRFFFHPKYLKNRSRVIYTHHIRTEWTATVFGFQFLFAFRLLRFYLLPVSVRIAPVAKSKYNN